MTRSPSSMPSSWLTQQHAAWEYSPGYVYVDWGNAVYEALLEMIDQLCPIESSLFANLGQEKKGNMLECVLADWRERDQWMYLSLLESILEEVGCRQRGIPRQRFVGPPPPKGYQKRLHKKFEAPQSGATKHQIA